MEDVFIKISKTDLKELIKEALLETHHEMQQPELLNIQEAAALLNLAVNTLYEKTSEKTIPHYKHGKKIAFKRSELLAWVEASRVETLRQRRAKMDVIALPIFSKKKTA